MNRSRRSVTASPRRRIATELRLFLLVLSCALPGIAAIVWLSEDAGISNIARGILVIAVVVWAFVIADLVREALLGHVRTLSNLLESARMQDYTMKGTHARQPGELGELYRQINNLIDSLRVTRQGEQELLSLLERVVSEINVAIVVFDSLDCIRLVNPVASALLKVPKEKLLGVNCADTILAQLPAAVAPELVDFRFPGAAGRWQIRQHSYRHQGQASRILFIADLQQVLSDEEIMAWQRLIRVISHEVNNSLTPISSLCQTLTGMLIRDSAANHEDVLEGLDVIAERAKGLQDFISAYARLARLPEPQKVLFPVTQLADNLRRIFTGQALRIDPFPEAILFGDPVHLEQALINLVKNALEANPADADDVELSCRLLEGCCEFQIADHGAGIGNPENLFVPFYTTKPAGAGIGLVLCRQIGARHNGQVTLENRPEAPGAVAKLTLPLPPKGQQG